MSEFKNFISGIILLCILCTGCFFAGYLFRDKRATEQLEQANSELREQQLKYDELIKSSEDRIREANQRVSDIREELYGKVSSNGETTRELSAIIEQIKKQRISL